MKFSTFNKRLVPIVVLFFLSVTAQAQITSPSPNTGDIGVSVSTSFQVPEATVSSLTDGTQYNLVVWSDPTGSPAVVETVGFTFDGTNGNTISLTGNLSYNTLYGWAIHLYGTTPDLTTNKLYGLFNFTTQLSLGLPVLGATGQLLLPSFAWQDASGLTNFADYTLQISKNSDMSSPVVTKTGITTNSYTLAFTDGILDENTQYYWQVTAMDAGDNTLNTSEIFNFTTANYDVVSSLDSPGNGLTGVSIQPNLKWTKPTAVNAPDHYRLVVSSSADFASSNWVYNVTNGTTAGADSNNISEANKLSNNTTYYWTVFGEDASNNIVSFKEYYQFKTTPSVSVNLLNPADNSTGVAASYVMFTWYTGSVNNGLKFYLQYDENSTSFTTADFNAVSSSTFYSKTNLLENTDYAWRVIAFIDNGNGTFETDQDVIVSYSSVFTFKTAGGTTINATPSYPTGGATVYTNTPTLYWYVDYYSSNIKYKIEINTSQSTTGTNYKSYDDITSMYKTVPNGDLNGGTTYYWRVTVKYNTSYGTPSSWAEFKTHGSGTLVVPTPSYPTNGVTVYSTSPTLYWSPNGDGSGLKYDIEIVLSTASFTSNPTTGTPYNDVDKFYSQISGLIPGKSYKWKVRADNGTNTSAWSSEATFTVAGGLSGGHAVVSYPSSNPTVYTNQPYLYWYLEGSTLGLNGYTVKYKMDSAPTGGWGGFNPTSNDENGGKFSISSIYTMYKQITVSLTYGKKYYWAVAANDGSSDGTFSEGSFTVVGGSSVQPVLTYPINGNTINTKSPILQWYVYGGASGITQYEIHYSKSGFLSSDSATTTTSGTETYKQLSGLVPGATYTWWVRGKYGTSSFTSWSNKETFVVDPGASPVQPWVGGPNNVTVPTTSPTISWVLPVQSESQLVYELEVADNPEFTNSSTFTSEQQFTQVDGLNLGKEYYWRARSKTVNTGQYSDFSPVAHFTVDQTTSVGNESIPTEFYVSQNYPNPFNPSTIIEFALPSKEFVSVKIYDILGREIKTLVNGNMSAGIHKLTWNGIDDGGAEVSAGAYIYRVVAGNNIVTRKMMLLK